jgi:DNA mismatch repair ATPase MutS
MELAEAFVGILDTYHFSEEMSGNELRFNYKLTSGIEYTRNAISLLKSCGYPEEIIADAEMNTLQKQSYNYE